MGDDVVLTNGALLKVGNGSGLASFAVSNGTLRTDSDLRVGALNRSLGRLTLADGLVDVGFEFTVGDANGSTGAVVVLNGILQALNTNANARIGQRGVGSFTISNGLARFDDVSVGRQDAGRGTLLVAGGEFDCGTLSIGRFSNAAGTATIAGGKLNVADGSLYVGREGAGTLTNLGGRITASRLFVPGATNTASGSARFSGGEAIFTLGLSLGSSVSSGQVVVDGGSLFCTNATGTSTAILANGTLVLADAFARVHAQDAGARLLIVGDGPERATLEATLLDRRIRDAVHFTGAVNPDEIPGWLASMHVAVAPYPALENFYFSPLKLFEYLAAGLPTIASRVGQVTEFLRDGETGLLVPPGDAKALASALLRLRADTALCARLGANGRATIERGHTWDAVVERLLTLATN